MNHPEINTETIKQRIRQEVMRRKAVLPEEKIEQGIEIFRSPESFVASRTKETRIWKFVKKVQYKLKKIPFYQLLYSVAAKFKGFIPKQYEFMNLNDLLSYQDEDFIRNAYRAILKREPDTDGFNDWLSRLRSGQLTKIEILGGISRSEEGNKRNVKIKGLWLRYWVNKSYKTPVAGYFIRVLTAIMNLPNIIRNLNEYQAFTQFQLAPFSPGDVTVVAVVTNHLFSLVWDMRTHGREPFKGIKDFFLFLFLDSLDIILI